MFVITGLASMHDFLLMAAGFSIALTFDWTYRFLSRKDEQKRKEKAKATLAKYGMNAHMYLAAMGVDNIEIRRALSVYDGYVVLDQNQEIVGRLLPKLQKAPFLRLVINNEDKEKFED